LDFELHQLGLLDDPVVVREELFAFYLVIGELQDLVLIVDFEVDCFIEDGLYDVLLDLLKLDEVGELFQLLNGNVEEEVAEELQDLSNGVLLNQGLVLLKLGADGGNALLNVVGELVNVQIPLNCIKQSPDAFGTQV
jgi:hypothetical protein